MGKKNKKTSSKKEKIAYLLLEGKTEQVFYKKIFDTHLQGISKKVINLKSGSGINKRVAKELYSLLKSNSKSSQEMYVYVFIDREGPRSKEPEFDPEAILELLRTQVSVDAIQVLTSIEAIQMIESWFFYDLEAILKHIGLKDSKSIRQSYSNPEKFTHKDLQNLFKKGSKNTYYTKGEESFLNKLDTDKIYDKVKELQEGMQRIKDYR